MSQEPAVGQIWKEVDPRQERYLRIEHGSPFGKVAVRTVVKKDGRWVDAPYSRISYCAAVRFNGKRGGYEFHASE